MVNIDIIIPHYKESEELIGKLLASIDLQLGIDFNLVNVIIVNDGDDVVLSDAFLNSFKNINIKYFTKEHAGVSAARNFGLKQSDADYVMFCDADDMFIRLNGLMHVFAVIFRDKPDVINSVFTIEQPKDTLGDLSNVPEELAVFCSEPSFKDLFIASNSDVLPFLFGNLFIHGKVFRRRFLLDNNLSFNESLSMSEDKCFWNVLLEFNPAISQITVPFYVWTFNSQSVTRLLDYLGMPPMLFHLPSTIDSSIAELSTLLALGKTDKLAAKAISFIYSVYMLLVGYNLGITSGVAEKMREATVKMAENYDLFNEYYKASTGIEKLRAEASALLLQTNDANTGVIDQTKLNELDFEDWWQSIGEINSKLNK